MKVIKKPVVCLLVDDDAEGQQTFIQALREIAPGSVCYIATDGTEAIRILSYGQRFPDYIFLDIHLSKTNGKEFLENVKAMEELKEVPIVIHTSHPAPGEIEVLHKLGVSGIHIKEFTHDSVCSMLNQYLI